MANEETTVVSSTEVLNLPFKVTSLDQDGLIAIAKNFQAIEDMLASMQLYMNSIGLDAINNALDIFNRIIMIGKEADMPKVNEAKGRRLYWAYDTQKLYLLRLKDEYIEE